MKPVLEHLAPEREESFFAQAFNLPYFGTPWHYHPEYELVWVTASQGKRFIGNSVSDFNTGDLSFLGPNLPHLYKNPPSYYENNPRQRARSVIIHFSEASLGVDLLGLPQAKGFRALFELSKCGLDILGQTKKEICRKMERLLESSGMKRFICLLEILDQLAASEECAAISDPGIIGHNALDTERLDTVFQFTYQNFEKDIRLEDIAGLVHMTRTSFCRFFQERTKKTYFTFLNNMRLNKASKLLLETERGISDIAYNCGFNNLSHFNRQFKSHFACSPKTYRETYAKAHR
ncbi:MAG TPA: helix-turn-helix domain-containing protein [Dinghuibacter sp.]|jgi:AraC-like DNA-binding protein|uniref:AraC family transcriptional regulator n=1 Tax=Dinghuibacter sp. TaxID=2024697 RepID=UPI002BA0B487|nr:helix-turn-helix domain-containing protein [Dinghuibacter sp.]HTJ13950.1 helix-turn-helix domain-containing protein [Dinghuibacter sp.]